MIKSCRVLGSRKCVELPIVDLDETPGALLDMISKLAMSSVESLRPQQQTQAAKKFLSVARLANRFHVRNRSLIGAGKRLCAREDESTSSRRNKALAAGACSAREEPFSDAGWKQRLVAQYEFNVGVRGNRRHGLFRSMSGRDRVSLLRQEPF